MKPALTHLAAALLGALFVFLLIGGPGTGESSEGNRDPALSPKSSRTTPPASRLDSRSRPSSEPRISDPDDIEALMARFGAKVPTRAELEDYLDAHGRKVEALLGAALIANDPDWLREALAKGGDLPHVLLAGAAFHQFSPEERLNWSQRLREVQPDNAIASYVLASSLIESGQPDEAIALLKFSATQGSLDDFFAETILAKEDIYRAVSGNALGAKLQSLCSLSLPMVSGLGAIGRLLTEQRENLPAEGANELRSLQASIGLRVSEGLPTNLLLTEVVGLGLQMTALKDLPEDAPSPFEGLTVSEANASLLARRREILDLVSPGIEIFAALPPAMMESYLDRVRLLGEFDAVRWLNQQLGDPAPQ